MIPGVEACLRFLVDFDLDDASRDEEASGASCFGNVDGEVASPPSSSSSRGDAARFLPAALLDIVGWK